MKYWLLIPVIFAGCRVPPSAPTVAELCEQTVRDYAILRDEGPVEAYADLFTEDGTFELAGALTTGRQALMERHIAANNASRWRHNIVDIRITDGEPITGTSRFIVYVGPKKAGAAAAREIIGDYVDIFALVDGQCKIASRKVNVIFDSVR